MKSLRTLMTGCLLALAACAPQLAATSASATASRSSPQCQSEDLSQWQPDPAPAAMQMSFQASCLPNGQAQLVFAKAGEQSLVRTIPTPGFSTARLTATAELSNAGVVAQIWAGGKLLAERGNGGNVDVQADVDQAGPVRYVLVVRAQGAGNVSLHDVKISVNKRG